MCQLDCLNLQPDSLEAKLLLELLKKEKRPGIDHLGSVLKKNSSYKVELEEEKHSIHLSHDLLFRARNKPDKPGFRCEIISNELLSKGGYAELYPILKTLSINEDFSSVGWKNTPKERVVKIQPKSSLAQEAKIIKLVPHLHSKSLIVDELTDKSYIVMKRLPGESLYEVLQLALKSESFGMEKRVQLLLKLLLALKSQVHDLGLIHKDIRADNILVTFDEEEEIFINIIDYGEAQEIEKGQQQDYDIVRLGGIAGILFFHSDCVRNKEKFYFIEDWKKIKDLITNKMNTVHRESRLLVDALITEVKAIQNEMSAKLTRKSVLYPSRFFQALDLQESKASMYSLPFQSNQSRSEPNLQDSLSREVRSCSY